MGKMKASQQHGDNVVKEQKANSDAIKAAYYAKRQQGPIDRANDPGRQINMDRQERMESKFGYELANPTPDTHDAEMEEANRRLR